MCEGGALLRARAESIAAFLRLPLLEPPQQDCDRDTQDAFDARIEAFDFVVHVTAERTEVVCHVGPTGERLESRQDRVARREADKALGADVDGGEAEAHGYGRDERERRRKKRNQKKLYQGNAVSCDFVHGEMARKRLKGGYTQDSPLIRSVMPPKGVVQARRGRKVYCLDATAGFGADAFLLACNRVRVTMVEHNPVMYVLLQDALDRALVDEETKSIAKRMKLVFANR